MKHSSFILFLLILGVRPYALAQFCPFGQESIYVLCNGSEEKKCIEPGNWTFTCNYCWIIIWPDCDNLTGEAGRNSFHTLADALEYADKEKTDGNNSCPWYYDQLYRIVLDNPARCPAIKPTGNIMGGSTSSGNGQPANDYGTGGPDFEDKDSSQQTTTNPSTPGYEQQNNAASDNPVAVDYETIIREAMEEYKREWYNLTGTYPQPEELARLEQTIRDILRNGGAGAEEYIATYQNKSGGKKSNEVSLPDFSSPTIKTFDPTYIHTEKGNAAPSTAPNNQGGFSDPNSFYIDPNWAHPGVIPTKDVGKRKPQ